MKKQITKIFISAFILVLVVLPRANSAAFDVSTYDAEVTDTTAILWGKASPDTIPTTAYFRYSEMPISPVFCNEIYGVNMVSTEDIPLVYSDQSFFQEISELSPDTTYYYCAIASSKNSIVYGNNGVKQFTTLPCPTCDPTSIETRSATDITKNSAILNGFINTTKPAQAWFEYRKDSVNLNSSETSGAWKTTAKQNIVQNAALPIFASVAGLSTNTLYNYRAAAKRIGNELTIYGETVNFKTSGANSTNPCPPFVAPPVLNEVPQVFSTTRESTGGGSVTSLMVGIPTVGVRAADGSVITNPSTVIMRTISGYFSPVIPSLGNPCPPENPPPRPGVFPLDPTGDPPRPGVFVPDTNIPVDAVVRFHEGVEHVFVRQIIGIPAIAVMYGYQSGVDNLQQFANDLAHFLAILFGYYENGKEIRVLPPDIAAYELKIGADGLLMVNEYYANILISSRVISDPFKKPPASYEYNFRN